MPKLPDRSTADLVTDLLDEGPLTGFELARGLEEIHSIRFRGREGGFYAALLELEQGGFITSEMCRREDGALRRYYFLPVLADVGTPVAETGA